MKDLKYLFAYTIPVSAYLSFTSYGLGTYTAVIYAFIIIPFLDSAIWTKQRKSSRKRG